MAVILADVMNRTFLYCDTSVSETSSSSVARILSRASITVTSAPRCENTWAISMPITPAPTMMREEGSCLISKISSLVRTPSCLNRSGLFGREPVAIMMEVDIICSSPI